MTRTSSLAGLLVTFFGAFVACNDSAEVLTPDTGTPEAGSDVRATDVTTQPDSSDATTSDAPDDAADAGADVGLTCDAGLEVCNNVCTDPSTYLTDNKNCGFCGHDCQGNACTNGTCAPDIIGSTLPLPSNLAVDGTNVYVTTSGDTWSTTSGAVYKCPVTGCPTKLGPMTSGLNNPNGITLDASRVYWDNSGDLSTADGSVMSCPLSDCGKNNSTRVTITKNLQFIQGIALDSTNVYFNYWGASPFLDGVVASCPLAGCTGTPASIITGQYKLLFTAVDGANVFASAMGGGASVPYVETGPIPGPTTGTRLYTGTIQNQIGGFVLFGGQFYFTDDFKGEIDFCPQTGCTTPLQLATNLNNPTALAVDSKGVYFIDGNGIERCPLTGCTTPTLLATPTPNLSPANIAINGNYVYWVEDDFNNATSGTIMRVAR